MSAAKFRGVLQTYPTPTKMYGEAAEDRCIYNIYTSAVIVVTTKMTKREPTRTLFLRPRDKRHITIYYSITNLTAVHLDGAPQAYFQGVEMKALF